jgi:hypothetical protein
MNALRLLLMFVLLSLSPQGQAAGALCAKRQGSLEIKVMFHEPVALHLVSADTGVRVAVLEAGSGSASARWVSPPDAKGCYLLMPVWPSGKGKTAHCLANEEAVAFAAAADAPIALRVRYLGARWDARDQVCERLPGEREATALPPPKKDVPLNGSGASLPAFDWPPPRPTARRTLARQLVATSDTPTLGGVADRLQAALESAGYVEYGYYRLAPGGFALATRLERIHSDGRPLAEPKRWELARKPLERFDLNEYLRALFDAAPGRFRIIVFAVTAAPLAAGADPPSAAAAVGWPKQGGAVLPPALRGQAYADGFQTHALIYEFEARGDAKDAVFLSQSAITGEAHLRQAKLLRALQP